MKAKALILMVAFAVAAAVAQRGGMGYGPGFKYDPSAETKLTGTIEEINTMDMMCQNGTHLVLKTDKGNMEAALGPSQFLKDQSLQLKKGDKVEVKGVKTTMRRGEVFIVRQITSGDKTVTLRNEKGAPAWSGGFCK